MTRKTFTQRGIATASRYVQTSAASTLVLFYEEDKLYRFIEVECSLPVMLLAFRECVAGKKNGNIFILKGNGLFKPTRRRLTPFVKARGTLCHVDAIKGLKTQIKDEFSLKYVNAGHVLEYQYSQLVGGTWDKGNNTAYYQDGDVVKPNGERVQCKKSDGSITERSTLGALKYRGQ